MSTEFVQKRMLIDVAAYHDRSASYSDSRSEVLQLSDGASNLCTL